VPAGSGIAEESLFSFFFFKQYPKHWWCGAQQQPYFHFFPEDIKAVHVNSSPVCAQAGGRRSDLMVCT
jgi:hypothetical protein